MTLSNVMSFFVDVVGRMLALPLLGQAVFLRVIEVIVLLYITLDVYRMFLYRDY